jgi:hypothetical protein
MRPKVAKKPLTHLWYVVAGLLVLLALHLTGCESFTHAVAKMHGIDVQRQTQPPPPPCSKEKP